ncbi:MAG: hypothetical protein PHW86_07110 [Candidatus Bipolaricaulis sp.]|nr:hypothetical protein [Candidatus Bipolaricaulis sp.]
MRWTVVTLVTLAAGIATLGLAWTYPWAVALAAGLLGGMWILLALWRPASATHVLPMLLCVGACTTLAVGDATRLLGLAGLPLALFAWDATVVLRAASRFSPSVPRSAALRYGIAVGAIGGGAVAVAVGGSLLPVQMTFPVALGLSVLLLGLAIALLWLARRPPTPASPDDHGDSRADAPKGTSAPHDSP